MGYETDVIHPSVEHMLIVGDFEYRHEVAMPIAGRADFVVYEHDLPTAVIECKKDCECIEASVAQVLRYAAQLGGDVDAWLIVPEDKRTSDLIKYCAKFGVQLGKVEIVA